MDFVRKTITSKIIKKKKYQLAGLRDYDETRYVVRLDVEFGMVIIMM